MASFDAKAIWCHGYRKLSLLAGCALLVLAARTQAEAVPDLYAISVPVAEQSQSELQRAATAGLRELAVRVSGRSSAATDPPLAGLFADAVRYLEQYRYERAGSDASWLAQLRFAPALIDGGLRKAGLPVWGGNRPALQTVVMVEDKGVRTVIDDSSAFATVLREQWRRRGLVLHLPRNGSAINVDDVAQLDASKVAAVTQERVDGFVLARIVLAPGGACESHWSLSPGTNIQQGEAANTQAFTAEATGSALSVCVASGLDRLIDNFSAQYAIASNSSAEGMMLRVAGVVTFDDYAALLNYLRRLAAVKSAQPLMVRGDEIVLQLNVAGDPGQLARQLALESRLTPTENPANTPLPAALSYRWSAQGINTLPDAGARN